MAVGVATNAGASSAPRIDTTAFVLGIPAVALVVFAFSALTPASIALVFTVDLWLFSFPHVASTFTRIAFSRRAARTHLALLTALPIAALAAAGGLVSVGGLVALNTVYFVWQSYHYTRQSYGIDRALRPAGSNPSRRDALGTALLYLVPAWGVLVRCAERPSTFLGVPLRLPKIPHIAVLAVGLAAMAACTVWCVRTVRDLAIDATPQRTTRALYVLVHVAMFTLGYVVVRDLTRGWLMVNVWHNAQYLAFVWIQNRRDHARAASEQSAALRWISRPGSAVRYFAACAAISTAAYGALFVTTSRFTAKPATVAFLVLMQAVNFHHYVVDAVIWKSRRRPSA